MKHNYLSETINYFSFIILYGHLGFSYNIGILLYIICTKMITYYLLWINYSGSKYYSDES